MKRVLQSLALLPLAAGALQAQAVPDSSQAAHVQPAYHRTPTFRIDPFRHAMIPHWGLVFSAGGLGENNSVTFADARALIYLQDKDSLTAGDVLNVLGHVPVGKGIKGSVLGEGGAYLGGPFGSHFSLGLSAQGRGYGSFQVDDQFVTLLRDGNGALQNFSLGNSKGAGLATAEAGAHAVLRFGPLGSEDGVNLNLGFGGRYIRPIAFARARSTLSNGGTVQVTGTTINANIGVELSRTPDIDSTIKGKASMAGDFLVRLTWPTSGFALEAMVANIGNSKVTVHRVETSADTFKVNSTSITEVKDSLDSFDPANNNKTTGDLQVAVPRIVRFTASAWANRILQLDVSATLPVHGDFESPLAVDVGTTWRFIRTIPLRAGVVLGGDQGVGFTGGLAIEGRNMIMEFMGQSLGGLFKNATGVGGRVEFGVFF